MSRLGELARGGCHSVGAGHIELDADLRYGSSFRPLVGAEAGLCGLGEWPDSKGLASGDCLAMRVTVVLPSSGSPRAATYRSRLRTGSGAITATVATNSMFMTTILVAILLAYPVEAVKRSWADPPDARPARSSSRPVRPSSSVLTRFWGLRHAADTGVSHHRCSPWRRRSRRLDSIPTQTQFGRPAPTGGDAGFTLSGWRAPHDSARLARCTH
jgi:hypothetical protein